MSKGKNLIMNSNYIKHVKYKNVLPKASTHYAFKFNIKLCEKMVTF